jgi:hypothetical protein
MFSQSSAPECRCLRNIRNIIRTQKVVACGHEIFLWLSHLFYLLQQIRCWRVQSRNRSYSLAALTWGKNKSIMKKYFNINQEV